MRNSEGYGGLTIFIFKTLYFTLVETVLLGTMAAKEGTIAIGA
jgi:hypothetical protein